MAEIWTMGELLVEIMRARPDMGLHDAGEFLGPFPSGAPAIFIDTVARLGHTGGVCGGVGMDDFGRCITDRLEADGVDVSRIRRIAGRATAVAFVAYADEGSREFIFHIDATPAVEVERPDSPDPDARFFHVMGCSLMASDRLRETIVETAIDFHAAGARISFDPNIRPELLGGRGLSEIVAPVLERTKVLLPGEEELALLTGRDDPAAAADLLFAGTGIEVIVLKRGALGARVYTRGTSVETPACAIQEVDPTGAGDCFDAAFLCGMLEGKPLHECARLAASAGALNAAAFGPMEGDISCRRVEELART